MGTPLTLSTRNRYAAAVNPRKRELPEPSRPSRAAQVRRRRDGLIILRE